MAKGKEETNLLDRFSAACYLLLRPVSACAASDSALRRPKPPSISAVVRLHLTAMQLLRFLYCWLLQISAACWSFCCCWRITTACFGFCSESAASSASAAVVCSVVQLAP
ncbi:hypothetical protein M9H77_07155 [Catharanthus roseus]|uniref:Uncharacterized protein n=1 Tax=Catharanthus roseus TaxID=4058 RepID=A0ACC0BU48_CATRO|nr:hypothetical protein M9H77_07155 [Catharanthus roseus]